MKKIILLISIILFTTACTNINKIDYKENIDNVIKYNKKNKIYNHYGNGYKYYLPKYMSIKNVSNYNEKINSNDNTYYLYVDIVSFFNKADNIIRNKCDETFEFGNNDGFLCINNVNNKYLVEIVYNYAKIEVIVDDSYLKEAINNSITILSTIKYDDELIENLIVENKINSNEETLSIFDDKKKKQDFIDVIEEYDNYDAKEDIPDFDVIN